MLKQATPKPQNQNSQRMIFKNKYLLVFKYNCEGVLMNIFDKSLKQKHFCCKNACEIKTRQQFQTSLKLSQTAAHHQYYGSKLGKFQDTMPLFAWGCWYS